MYKICVTNRELVRGNYNEQLKKALCRKPDALILREKTLSKSEYEKLAKEVMKLCNEYKVDFIVNSFIDTAIKLKIKYVQVSLDKFLQLSDNQKEAFEKIGVSVHSVEEAIRAEKEGADFVIAGHIFETNCKKGVPPRGIEFLKNVCEAVDIPVYAIGGIHDNNSGKCIEAGAQGVCQMSEYMCG